MNKLLAMSMLIATLLLVSSASRSQPVAELANPADLTANTIALNSSGGACDAILRFGIRDEYETFQFQSHFKQVNNFICKSEFSSYSKAIEQSASLNIPIVDVLSIGFGGKNAQSEWSEWRSAFCSTEASTVANDNLFRQRVTQTSQAIVNAWSTCIEGRKGLISYIVPVQGDNRRFSLHLKYDPTAIGLDTAQITMVNEDTRNSCTGLKRWYGGYKSFGEAGLSADCKRPDENVPVLVLIDTSQGNVRHEFWVPPAEAPPVAPPPVPKLACLSEGAGVQLSLSARCETCAVKTESINRWNRNRVANTTGPANQNALIPQAEAGASAFCSGSAESEIELRTAGNLRSFAGWGDDSFNNNRTYRTSRSDIRGSVGTTIQVAQQGFCLWVVENRVAGTRNAHGPGSYRFKQVWENWPANVQPFAVIGPSGDTRAETGDVFPLTPGQWRINGDLGLSYESIWNENSGEFTFDRFMRMKFVRALPDGSCPGAS